MNARPGWYWVKPSALSCWQVGLYWDQTPPREVDAQGYGKDEPAPEERRVIFTPTAQARVEMVSIIGQWGIRLETPRQPLIDQQDRMTPGWYWALRETGEWVAGEVLPYDALSGSKGTVFRTVPSFCLPDDGPYPLSVRQIRGWVRLSVLPVSDDVALGRVA